jgi:hypothetical protein
MLRGGVDRLGTVECSQEVEFIRSIVRCRRIELSKAPRDVCYSIHYTTLSSLTHCIPLLAKYSSSGKRNLSLVRCA